MEARKPKQVYKLVKLPDKSMAFSNAVVLPERSGVDASQFLACLHAKNGGREVYYPIMFDKSMPPLSVALSSIIRDDLDYQVGEEIYFKHINKSACYIQQIDEVTMSIRRVNRIASGMLKRADLLKKIVPALQGFPLNMGQDILLAYAGGLIVISIGAIISRQVNIESNKPCIFHIDAFSKCHFEFSPLIDVSDDFSLALMKTSLFSNSPQFEKLNQFEKKIQHFNFNLEDVGGYKKQIERIVRQAFYSRILPPEYAESYGIKHAKGMLIYGPSGTGKTLIARSIAKNLGAKNVKVVNGPELKNKFIGQSPENMRNVFKDAIEAWDCDGENSDLHIIIFDELDGLVPVRGRHQSSGVDDEMVTQLLTLLDGVDSPGNVFVIGITNRKDLIDNALLRPGRLEIQLEIGLPDEQSRYDILLLKTREMREAALLDEQVDLRLLAKQAKNFTGAELEFLVRSATQYAVSDNFETVEDGKKIRVKENIHNKAQLCKVMDYHFKLAFKEIKPAHGIGLKEKDHTTSFVIYDQHLESIINHFLNAVKNNPHVGFNLLISGYPGTGKSALALYLANLSQVAYVKLVSSDNLLGMSLDKQLLQFDQLIEEVRQVDLALVILDGLEEIIMADAECSIYNNPLRLKLISFLNQLHHLENKPIIIATTSQPSFIKKIALQSYFNEFAHLNLLSLTELAGENSTLRLLCDKLGLAFQPGIKLNGAEPEIYLSIRDFLYQARAQAVVQTCHTEPNSMLATLRK